MRTITKKNHIDCVKSYFTTRSSRSFRKQKIFKIFCELTLSALRGGENSPPPYENSLSYFCEWVIFFQLLMTFQFETSNICWLGKIICLTWKKLRNPGSNISSLLIYLSNIQCPKWSANPITVTPIWKLRFKVWFL